MKKLSIILFLLISCPIVLGENNTQKGENNTQKSMCNDSVEAIYNDMQESIYKEKINIARNMIELEKLLFEAEKNFTFNGNPIHPRIIKSFENWENDFEEPYKIAYDLNMAENTNKYPNFEIIKSNDGWIGFISEKTDSVIYEYKFIGSLENKLNIVISKNLAGYTLHAFEFKIEQGLSRKDLKLYNRLVLKSYFQIRLEPIDDISINDNNVIVNGKIIKIEREISADVEGKVYKLGFT